MNEHPYDPNCYCPSCCSDVEHPYMENCNCERCLAHETRQRSHTMYEAGVVKAVCVWDIPPDTTYFRVEVCLEDKSWHEVKEFSSATIGDAWTGDGNKGVSGRRYGTSEEARYAILAAPIVRDDGRTISSIRLAPHQKLRISYR